MQTNIAAGEAVSGDLALNEQSVVGLFMPDEWTAADIQFEGSINGNDYLPLHDAEGLRISVDAGPSRYIVIPPEVTRGVAFLRLRSVSDAGADVVQAAQRAIGVETVK